MLPADQAGLLQLVAIKQRSVTVPDGSPGPQHNRATGLFTGMLPVGQSVHPRKTAIGQRTGMPRGVMREVPHNMVPQRCIVMHPEEKMAVQPKTAAVPPTGIPQGVMPEADLQPVTERFIVTDSTEHRAKSNYLI